MTEIKAHDRETHGLALGARLVWLVEDNLDDASLITQALQEMSPTARVVHVNDCEDARRRLHSPSERKPCLILLAWNALAGNTLHFLESIKAEERLKTIAVVALARSREECDVRAGYALGLAGYVVKPVDRIQLWEIIAATGAYWTLSLMPQTS